MLFAASVQCLCCAVSGVCVVLFAAPPKCLCCAIFAAPLGCLCCTICSSSQVFVLCYFCSSSRVFVLCLFAAPVKCLCCAYLQLMSNVCVVLFVAPVKCLCCDSFKCLCCVVYSACQVFVLCCFCSSCQVFLLCLFAADFQCLCSAICSSCQVFVLCCFPGPVKCLCCAVSPVLSSVCVVLFVTPVKCLCCDLSSFCQNVLCSFTKQQHGVLRMGFKLICWCIREAATWFPEPFVADWRRTPIRWSAPALCPDCWLRTPWHSPGHCSGQASSLRGPVMLSAQQGSGLDRCGVQCSALPQSTVWRRKVYELLVQRCSLHQVQPSVMARSEGEWVRTWLCLVWPRTVVCTHTTSPDSRSSLSRICAPDVQTHTSETNISHISTEPECTKCWQQHCSASQEIKQAANRL